MIMSQRWWSSSPHKGEDRIDGKMVRRGARQRRGDGDAPDFGCDRLKPILAIERFCNIIEPGCVGLLALVPSLCPPIGGDLDRSNEARCRIPIANPVPQLLHFQSDSRIRKGSVIPRTLWFGELYAHFPIIACEKMGLSPHPLSCYRVVFLRKTVGKPRAKKL